MQQLQERFLVVMPPESVLGVADFKTLQMQFPKQSLKRVVVRVSKNRVRAITLVGASLDEAIAPEQGEPCPCSARNLEQRREAVGTESVTKIKINFLTPSRCLALWC